jgi:multidrug efflux pump subunit AcrA (membrane-fusion protein)
VGPRHTWAKLAAVAGCLLLLFVTLYPAPHRVSAPFVLQPQERQLVVAPFDGYLKAVHVEPGDRVVPGRTLLAELETAELRLQLAEKLAARVQHLKEADLARREGKTAEVQIAEAEAERAAAEIALLEHQIDKASLRSPLAGVVQEGDHKRKTGGAVSKGEVLFEVAPPDVLKAELRVPEDRVAELRVGQRGELAAAAQPGLYVPFIIEKIEPKAEVLDGQNVFRVWATLEAGGDGHAHGFRGKPGMEGVAKVEVGTTNYLWVWTHEAIEWVRMKLWI